MGSISSDSLGKTLNIASRVKFKSHYYFNGKKARPGHKFIKTSCTWLGKDHWNVREINIGKFSKVQLQDMYKQLKEEMINTVANYVA